MTEDNLHIFEHGRPPCVEKNGRQPQQIEDYHNFSTIEDDLNFVKNGRQTQPFQGWKMTSIITALIYDWIARLI